MQIHLSLMSQKNPSSDSSSYDLSSPQGRMLYVRETTNAAFSSWTSPLQRQDPDTQEEKKQEEQYGSFTKFPDLILMDGGKGQVHSALSVLEKLKLEIPVCGMVKDDKHRTRGLYYQNQEISIEKDSEAFRLITRIQDEAHRFAIEYHRSLRSKNQIHSVLDEIEGIGPARRKALMKKYQSLEAIREASAEDLADTESMNEKAAQAVYEFLHKDAVL